MNDNACHHLALRHMPAAHNRWWPSSVGLWAWQPSNAVISASTACARSDRAPLRKTSVSASAKSSWLGELENVSVGLGVSLLQWRNGGFGTPHDTPPYPLMP